MPATKLSTSNVNTKLTNSNNCCDRFICKNNINNGDKVNHNNKPTTTTTNTNNNNNTTTPIWSNSSLVSSLASTNTHTNNQVVSPALLLCGKKIIQEKLNQIFIPTSTTTANKAANLLSSTSSFSLGVGATSINSKNLTNSSNLNTNLDPNHNFMHNNNNNNNPNDCNNKSKNFIRSHTMTSNDRRKLSSSSFSNRSSSRRLFLDNQNSNSVLSDHLNNSNNNFASRRLNSTDRSFHTGSPKVSLSNQQASNANCNSILAAHQLNSQIIMNTNLSNQHLQANNRIQPNNQYDKLFINRSLISKSKDNEIKSNTNLNALYNFITTTNISNNTSLANLTPKIPRHSVSTAHLQKNSIETVSFPYPKIKDENEKYENNDEEDYDYDQHSNAQGASRDKNFCICCSSKSFVNEADLNENKATITKTSMNFMSASRSSPALTADQAGLINNSRKAPLAPHLDAEETKIDSSIYSDKPSASSSSSSSSSSSKIVKTTILTFVNDKKSTLNSNRPMNSIDERYIYVGAELNSVASTQSSLSSSTSSSSSLSLQSPFQSHVNQDHHNMINNISLIDSSIVNSSTEDTLTTTVTNSNTATDTINDSIPSTNSGNESILNNNSHDPNHTCNSFNSTSQEECFCSCNCECNNLSSDENNKCIGFNNFDSNEYRSMFVNEANNNNSNKSQQQKIRNVPKPQPRSIYLNYDQNSFETNQFNLISQHQHHVQNQNQVNF